MNKEYSISNNGLFRYLITNKLENSELCVMDFNMNAVHNNPGQMNTISAQLNSTRILKDDIKSIKQSQIRLLYEKILNYYVNNSIDTNELEVDLNINENDDNKKIILKMLRMGNIIARQSRLGPATHFILPKNIYNNIKTSISISDPKYLINPTKIHNDKIFCLRLDKNTLNSGVSIVTDIDLYDNHRGLKLIKILNKIKPNHKYDNIINYVILSIGSNAKNTIGILKINK